MQVLLEALEAAQVGPGQHLQQFDLLAGPFLKGAVGVGVPFVVELPVKERVF